MMMLISFLALLGNAVCLYLFAKKVKVKEATYSGEQVIFTNNDVMINLGVIIGCWGFSLFYT